MSLNQLDAERALLNRGYELTHQTNKKRGFTKAGRSPVYVNQVNRSDRSLLILHPDSSDRDLALAIPGVRVGDAYYHSSNLKLFPKRIHTGKQPIGYGWPDSSRTSAWLSL